MGITNTFNRLLNVADTWLGVVETSGNAVGKLANAADNICYVAEQSSGLYRDVADAERQLKRLELQKRIGKAEVKAVA